MSECRECSVCVGSEHHWIPNASEAFPAWYDCKHCDTKGVECDGCDGEGCDACNGEGVVEAAKGATR
jgi:hypothetical protein